MLLILLYLTAGSIQTAIIWRGLMAKLERDAHPAFVTMHKMYGDTFFKCFAATILVTLWAPILIGIALDFLQEMKDRLVKHWWRQ